LKIQQDTETVGKLITLNINIMDNEIQDMLNDLPNKKFAKLTDAKLQQYEDNKNLLRDENWKNKISGSLKNRKLSKEHVEKITQRNKEKIVSDETKKKLSLSLIGKTKGYKRSEETKKRIGESRKHVIYSEEAKKRMSDAQKKRTNHFNEIAISKRIESTKKPILCYRLSDMEFLNEYDSIKSASENLNLHRDAIKKIIEGKSKKPYCGYMFKYKDIS
jgi:hypothetical protein